MLTVGRGGGFCSGSFSDNVHTLCCQTWPTVVVWVLPRDVTSPACSVFPPNLTSTSTNLLATHPTNPAGLTPPPKSKDCFHDGSVVTAFFETTNTSCDPTINLILMT